MKTILNENATENSVYGIEIDFQDMTGTPVSPNSLTWTLTDETGHVVNNRYQESAPLNSSIIVILNNNDLAVYPTTGLKRFLLVEVEYDSTYGTGLTLKAECEFRIEPLVSFPTVIA